MCAMSSSSMPWEHYARQAGQEFYPEPVLLRLTVKQGLKDLMALVGMDGTPFRKAWYERKFVELSDAELEPVDRWMNLTALLGLIHNKFSSVKLKVPEDWNEGYLYAKKDYTFSMCKDFSDWSSQEHDWDRNFHNPKNAGYVEPGKKNPWLLRQQLADEFTELYFGKLREIIQAITKASSPEETLKQHRALRELVDECAWFDRMMMMEKIGKALPSFAAEFVNSTDPAVRFAITALDEIVNWRAKSSRDTAKILLQSYFDKLKDISKAADAKKVVDLISFEVFELLDAQDAIAQSKGHV
jgi:hypothetical protein